MIAPTVLTLFVAVSTLSAEALKSSGRLSVAQLFRLAVAVVSTGGAVWFRDDFRMSVLFGMFVVLAVVLSAVDTFRKPHVYRSYLDVPRQTLYREDPSGKCIVLSDGEARDAHARGVDVYIHAVTRIKYGTKDAPHGRRCVVCGKPTTDGSVCPDCLDRYRHTRERKRNG